MDIFYKIINEVQTTNSKQLLKKKNYNRWPNLIEAVVDKFGLCSSEESTIDTFTPYIGSGSPNKPGH